MPADRLPELFARAFELGEAERANLVDELERSDAALAAELARLLASARSPSSPLDRSQKPRLWGLGNTESRETSLPPSPEQIGAYRIVGELGRGGMGRVYLAEEQTPEFRRTVALKVIDRPGADEDAIRRFRDEVRILASLEHPGIARFLDGGRTPDGTWFLALERVEGESLVAWAAARGLPVRARIELFLAVLDAVAFAHEKGIVHRDLKPAHLLVGADGRPRLLDFGISKLVDAEAGEGMTVTRTEARAMTPAYASPEQFRGEPVTRASDIYSLGVVLYELLAGRRPFAAAGESRGALERAVLGTDPEPPSRAARDLERGEALSASTGQTTAGRAPDRRLGRDLDAICLKALRKLPGDRYATAADFADDLRRFLDGRPVEARRGGRRYRAARFVARRRGALLVGAALLVAIASIGVALDARRRAASVAPVEAPAVPPLTGTETVAELERRFAAAPGSLEAGSQLALRLTGDGRTPEAAVVLGRVRQLPGGAADALVDYTEAKIAINLGEHQRALALSSRALANARAQGHGDLVPAIRLARARSLTDLGQIDEGHAELERARADAEAAADFATLALALNNLAAEAAQQSDLGRSASYLEQASIPARKMADGSMLAIVLANLSSLDLERGRPDLAVPRSREAIAQFEKLGKKKHVAIVTGYLGNALFDLGRADESRRTQREAVTGLREQGDDGLLSVVLADVATGELAAARVDGIEASAAEIQGKSSDEGYKRGLALAESLRARLSWLRGDLAAARRQFADASRLHVENGDLDQASALDVAHAEAEQAAGETERASALLDAVLKRIGSGADTNAAFVAGAVRASIDAAAGRLEAARTGLSTLAPDPVAAQSSPSLRRRLTYLRARAAIATAERRYDDARADLRLAIAAAKPAERVVDTLGLRLEIARIAKATKDPGVGVEISRIESEARAVGLLELAERARAAGS